ncbi:MAG TPA: MFS transporter [Burkholderiales bacterium]|nr:MFS transporter [Burkholderiales bacterium]
MRRVAMPPVFVVLTVVLLNMTAYRGSRVIVTLFAVDMGVPQFYIGVLAAMFSVFPMMLGLYAGRLTDRLGVRIPMAGGSIGVGLGLLVPYLFPAVPALYVSSALMGASWVFYNVCAQNLIGDLSTAETRAKNFSNYGLVMAGGSFAGPMLVGFAIDHLGYSPSYLVLAAVTFSAACVTLYVRVPPANDKAAAPDEQGAYSASLMKNVPLRRTLITSGIVLTGTDLFQFYMPIYGRSINLSASMIGIILGMFAVAAFVVRLVMPKLVKRYGADAVLVGSLYMGAFAYLLFPLFETPVLLAVMAFVLGLGMGCSQPVSLMLIYDRAPPGRSGEALGLRLMINNFTHIVVPLMFGSLGTAFGVAPVFIANAAILGAGGILSSRAKSAAVDVPAG